MEQPRTKKALLKIEMIGKGLLFLIGLKILIIMHDTAKHCYFKCLRSPDVNAIKIFDKDDQAAKHLDVKEQCFAT